MRGESMKDKSKKSTYSTTFGIDPYRMFRKNGEWGGRTGMNSNRLLKCISYINFILIILFSVKMIWEYLFLIKQGFSYSLGIKISILCILTILNIINILILFKQKMSLFILEIICILLSAYLISAPLNQVYNKLIE